MTLGCIYLIQDIFMSIPENLAYTPNASRINNITHSFTALYISASFRSVKGFQRLNNFDLRRNNVVVIKLYSVETGDFLFE